MKAHPYDANRWVPSRNRVLKKPHLCSPASWQSIVMLASTFFKSSPLTAPVAAALLAVPFRHAFPLFAVSANGSAFFQRFTLSGGRNAVNDRYNVG
jgi:hypothetical protein